MVSVTVTLVDGVTCHSALLSQLVYVSVRGVQRHNTFTIVIWDLIFEQDEYALELVEGRGNGTVFLRLQEQLRTNNVT